MKPLTLQEIRQATGGKPLSPIPATAPAVTAICTDTRMMESGSLFVALVGERFDGNRFLPQAAAGGAIAALVQGVPPVDQPNVHLISVPDTRVALGRLARYVRQQLRSKVIGVAGSNGKTSTKHLIHAALGSTLRGSISPKSFNNDIGVPLAIFPADPLQDYLVLEMGTNHHGEIRVLTERALPDIAVITNCSAEHLEGLDDLMGVRRENASVIEGLNPKGLLVVNGDDPQLLDAVEGYAGRRVTFGFGPHNDLFATDIECDARGTRFRLNNSRREVFVPMLGRHSAANALAALAVARRMGLKEEAVITALAESSRPDMRLQLQQVDGVTIINDAYNANPASMKAALETVSTLQMPVIGRRIAVIGDMRELGKSSERYHRELGAFAAGCALDELVCVGELGALMAEAARQAGMPPQHLSHFSDASSAAQSLVELFKPGDLVLVKASRAVRLENIVQALMDKPYRAGKRAAG